MNNTQCQICGFVVIKAGYLPQHHRNKKCFEKFEYKKNYIFNKFKYNFNINDLNEYNNLSQNDCIESFGIRMLNKYHN
jgi:hypothetical protein